MIRGLVFLVLPVILSIAGLLMIIAPEKVADLFTGERRRGTASTRRGLAGVWGYWLRDDLYINVWVRISGAGLIVFAVLVAAVFYFGWRW